jgi:UDP-N-acetyl-D-mannosaminuronic acid dehydrogenase
MEQETGGRLNERFFLGVCPERVMPGKLLKNLRELARVCGGSNEQVAKLMQAFYRQFTAGEVDATDMVTAEIVKTAENAYRDVNIAFANELALICEACGGDFMRVRELVNKSPGRNVLLAGAGVGGHCIPKDPWLLAYGASEGTSLNVIFAARKTNDEMPRQMLTLLRSACRQIGLASLKGLRVGILGYSYIENSDDARQSPTEDVISLLRSDGAVPIIHDPFVDGFRRDVMSMANDCDALLIMVAHSQYRDLDWRTVSKTMQRPILIDGRRVIEHPNISRLFVYRAIGLASS